MWKRLSPWIAKCQENVVGGKQCYAIQKHLLNKQPNLRQSKYMVNITFTKLRLIQPNSVIGDNTGFKIPVSLPKDFGGHLIVYWMAFKRVICYKNERLVNSHFSLLEEDSDSIIITEVSASIIQRLLVYFVNQYIS